MTTSFPSTSPAEIALSASSTVPSALTGDLAALLGASASESPVATNGPACPSTDFGALLGGDTATPAPVAPQPATSPAATPVANPGTVATAPGVRTVTPTTATSVPPLPTSVAPSIPVAPSKNVPPSSTRGAPTDARGLARGVTVAAVSGDADEAMPEASPAVTATMPDRATLEAVAALLAPVAALVAPPPAEAPLTPVATSPDEHGAENADGDTLPGGVPSAVEARRGGAIALSVTLPERTTPAPAPGQPFASASAPEVVDATAAAPQTEAAPTSPATVSETFVVPNVPSRPAPSTEPRPTPIVRASTPVRPTTPGLPVSSAPEQAPLQVEASVELPDGVVVALALPTAPVVEGQVASKNVPATESVTPRAENSAASNPESPEIDFGEKKSAGKNFLTADKQELSLPEKKAGIGVAETRPTMLFIPHDTFSAVSPTVPAIVSVVPAQTQVVAAGSPEPMPQLVAASFAKRAVETVTNVVDAQAASKLQPVPSVQLKFKFGTEDLAVRVELRNGTVRTEFRTDSPELRAAISNEWKAVAAQPESALRFLEPVVSPTTSPQTGTGSFAQQQHQQSPGQSAAQQQQQQNQQQARAQEFFGSIARSTPFQPRDGGAATSAAPVVLPTSVHLSAVA